MKEKSERVLYLDAIRGAATIAVIFLHIATQNFYINPHEPAWGIFNLIEASVRWGVPVFVMMLEPGGISQPESRRISQFEADRNDQ